MQNDKGEIIFFIYNDAEEESVFSAFEITPDLIISEKIEEIDTPEGAFIITRGYDLENKDSEVIVFLTVLLRLRRLINISDKR
ncbi:MAG: hypothetical protein LUG95_09460 [Clostridiales bacterium]|nr:hypothetical protein [Clostridiales bacterium]